MWLPLCQDGCFASGHRGCDEVTFIQGDGWWIRVMRRDQGDGWGIREIADGSGWWLRDHIRFDEWLIRNWQLFSLFPPFLSVYARVRFHRHVVYWWISVMMRDQGDGWGIRVIGDESGWWWRDQVDGWGIRLMSYWSGTDSLGLFDQFRFHFNSIVALFRPV